MIALIPYFSGSGRATRSQWFRRVFLLAVGCVAVAEVLSPGPRLSALLALLFIWVAACLSIQRLHDCGKSGWLLLIAVVPVIGPLWLLIQLLRKGSAGSSVYGPDPVRSPDPLAVNISR